MKKDTKIVELLRSVMYSSAEDGNENLLEEIEDLAVLLGERDKVPYNLEQNRLVKAMYFIKNLSEEEFNKIEHLNDPK